MSKEPAVDNEFKRVNMAIPVDLVEEIDDWRRIQRSLPNFSEAVRQLIKNGLKPNQ